MLAVYKFILTLIFWSFCESFHDLLNDRLFYINKIKVANLEKLEMAFSGIFGDDFNFLSDGRLVYSLS